MSDSVEFLGLDFTIASAASWRDRLLSPPASGFRILVTPNVDHVVQLSKQPALIPVYAAADWRMCDSRILARLARFRGIDLACYPGADLVLVPAPFMRPGSPEWETALQATEAAQADLTLLCLSFPKQEIFAKDLKQRGRARGIALCVGASVDFLTGQQVRAPKIFRRTGMEWLHRLLSQPGRLWKRYLVDGPRIFLLYLRDRRQRH